MTVDSEFISAGRRDCSDMHSWGPGTRTCYVVIAGDRGLAGGYNANLFKCLEAAAEGKDYVVLPIGKKAVEYFRQRRVLFRSLCYTAV